MDRFCQALRRFRSDARGAMAIETALVAPALILMSLGSFQVSSMVARQNELQSAAAEAAAIALASPPSDEETLETYETALRDILKRTAALDDEEVSVGFAYRCGDEEELVADSIDCDAGVPIWSFLTIDLQTQYVPVWTEMGISGPVTLRVNRTVQVS